jgi:hypothetical protein
MPPSLELYANKYSVPWKDSTHWGAFSERFRISGFENSSDGRLSAMAAYEAVVQVCGGPASSFTAELAALPGGPELVTEFVALKEFRALKRPYEDKKVAEYKAALQQACAAAGGSAGRAAAARAVRAAEAAAAGRTRGVFRGGDGLWHAYVFTSRPNRNTSGEQVGRCPTREEAEAAQRFFELLEARCLEAADWHARWAGQPADVRTRLEEVWTAAVGLALGGEPTVDDCLDALIEDEPLRADRVRRLANRAAPADDAAYRALPAHAAARAAFERRLRGAGILREGEGLLIPSIFEDPQQP